MLHTVPVRQSLAGPSPGRQETASPSSTRAGDRTHRLQRFRCGPILVGLFLCLLGIAVYIWPRIQVVRLAYRLQGSERQLRELLQERDQLRLDLAGLKDPERVYRLATEQLNMREPELNHVIVVSPSPKGR